MKALLKIDQFYILFALILFVLAIIVTFTLRTIFSSLEVAGEVNEELFQARAPRINKLKIDQAISIYEDNEIVLLDL